MSTDDLLSRAPSELNLDTMAPAQKESKNGMLLAKEDRWIATLDLNGFAAELKSLGKRMPNICTRSSAGLARAPQPTW